MSLSLCFLEKGGFLHLKELIFTMFEELAGRPDLAWSFHFNK